MRLNSALKIYNDGVLSFSELCTQVGILAHQSQLYFADKRAATEVQLWAYAMARATELDTHNVSGEEARGMYEHLLLRHGHGSVDASPAAPSTPPDPDQPPTPEDELRDDELHRREAALSFLLGVEDQRARVEALILSANQPVFIAQQLTAMLRICFDRGVITNIRALIAVHQSVERMQLQLAACQRVMLSPEPYSYASLMKT